eukprot:2927482-Pleurochrysis_carterae.AAC.1
MDPAAPGGAVYNVDTLAMFAEFMRRSGSRHTSQPDKVLRAGTVAGYGSAVRMLRSRETKCEIAPEPPGGRSTLAVALKRMRLEDPLTGSRKLSRGFRAQLYRAVVAAGGWNGPRRAHMEWVAALLAHNLLLRAGEMGHPNDGGEFDFDRDLTWSSVQWMQPPAASEGHEWALVFVFPITDASDWHKKVPMPLRRRQRGGRR